MAGAGRLLPGLSSGAGYRAPGLEWAHDPAHQRGHGPVGEPGLRVVGGPRTPAGTRVSNAQ